MRGRTLALALALFPALLAAQQGPAVPRPQVRCAAYDSLMAGVTRSDPGIASVQGRGAARFIHIQGTWSLSDQDHGITGVDLTLMADSGVGPATASVEVMAHLSEQLERPVTERQGVLLLDDTLTIPIGSMNQTPGADFPNGVKTWYLFAFAARGALPALARARKIEFEAGSTRWAFPDKLMQNIRGGLAALVCQR